MLDKWVLSTHVIQHKAQAGDFIEPKLLMVTESNVFVQNKLFEKTYLDLNLLPHEREVHHGTMCELLTYAKGYYETNYGLFHRSRNWNELNENFSLITGIYGLTLSYR